MKKNLFVIVILTIYALPSSAQADSTVQGQLSDLLIQNNQDFFIEYQNTKKLTEGYLIRNFIYHIKEGDWPGGSGFEVTKSGRNVPIWYKMHNGDFGPYSIQILDLNNDGKKDLFFYAGFEDVYSSHIYLGQYEYAENVSYSEDNFVKVYSNKNEYSVIIDPNNDIHPEILDSGYEGRKHMSGTGCTDYPSGIIIKKENRVTISDSLKDKVAKKYHQITGEFDQFNDNSSPLANSFLFSPIKIFRIQGEQVLNVTSEYPEYLTWRIEILQQIGNDSSERCQDRIYKAITHLKNQL